MEPNTVFFFLLAFVAVGIVISLVLLTDIQSLSKKVTAQASSFTNLQSKLTITDNALDGRIDSFHELLDDEVGRVEEWKKGLKTQRARDIELENKGLADIRQRLCVLEQKRGVKR